jgi:hypothetical protein
MSKEVKRYNPLIVLARNAKLQRMDIRCDPQWVLDLAAERDALLAERDRLRETLEAQSWELASPNISYALRDQLLGQLAGDHEPEEILCVEDFYSWLANAIDNIRAEHRKAEGGQPMQVRASAMQGAQP